MTPPKTHKKSLSRKKKPDSLSYSFQPDGISFSSSGAFSLRTIYFPLCGVDSGSVKSSISPRLGGDIKINKNCYLTMPASVEDLRRGLRNFYCRVNGKNIVSLAEPADDKAVVEGGMLWHQLTRAHKTAGLEIIALNFVPVTGENAELMKITVRNISKSKVMFTPTFGVPLFARALANKHDHEHVTSLLHRTHQLKHGVCVEPTMIFDERGHKQNSHLYYVLGFEGNGKAPRGTFPTVEAFYGDGGSFDRPHAVFENAVPKKLDAQRLHGKEAMGAIRFKDQELPPGGVCQYGIMMGAASSRQEMLNVFARFNGMNKIETALKKNIAYWGNKINSVRFSTGDQDYNTWLRWVTIQPVLRRIFGCSFLPEHDYGKGGKGWRDLWQDLLSLILIEPERVREMLINNFAGVRIDGSNATIIGSVPGEFLADRNFITRVWMDHGVWPFATLLLYINQTGDHDILFEDNTYFRDVQLSRAFEKDYAWSSNRGNFLVDKTVKVYRGTILEHVLIQHLVQFYNVGEHNITRLEDADWNDGLDMAKERGESVAFMSFYGGNMLDLADLLEKAARAGSIDKIELADEVKTLLDTLTDAPLNYDDPREKERHLFEAYFPLVQPDVSGKKSKIPVTDIVKDLRKKGNWIFRHIKQQEKISSKHRDRAKSWFNGYYDNKGQRVEGYFKEGVRMTLTGQVFAIMSGLADKKDISDVIGAVNAYLRDNELGGIRLNTDFRLPHGMDLGRAFGFAYGNKENGAFFSHMNVMYAYALYKRGYAREGYTVLRSIYNMCADTSKSKIYPGIPEYFDSEGRGHYHYLTGAASWMILTQLTQAFGVRGESGDLLVAPQLVKEEFDIKTAEARVFCQFAGKEISVSIKNPARLDHGRYKISAVKVNGEPVDFDAKKGDKAIIPKTMIKDASGPIFIEIILGAL